MNILSRMHYAYKLHKLCMNRETGHKTTAYLTQANKVQTFLTFDSEHHCEVYMGFFTTYLCIVLPGWLNVT